MNNVLDIRLLCQASVLTLVHHGQSTEDLSSPLPLDSTTPPSDSKIIISLDFDGAFMDYGHLSFPVHGHVKPSLKLPQQSVCCVGSYLKQNIIIR